MMILMRFCFDLDPAALTPDPYYYRNNTRRLRELEDTLPVHMVLFLD